MADNSRIEEEQINVDNIQGDILVGLQKDFEIFVGFEIVDVAAFRVFLHDLVPRITTLRTTLEREFLLEMRHKLKSSEVFTFLGTNIAFTFAGLQTLGIADLDKITDSSFRAGLAARSGVLNDPTTGKGAPTGWVLGAASQKLHGLLIVTGPDKENTYGQFHRIVSLAGASWRPLGVPLEGKTRAPARGHEHFGFLDGVSQPAVRGRIDAVFPSRKFLVPSENPNDPDQGKPGQDLIATGEFVFGYVQQREKEDDLPVVADGGLPWMKDGSFMVFRRLLQLVPEFEAFCEAEAAAFGTDAGLVASRLVGRWPSGAPLVTSPLQDNAELAKDDHLVNAFEFSQDKEGRRCPFAAHIRKAYPRDDITPAGNAKPTEAAQRERSEADTETHRILRAGIPFGDELSDEEREKKATITDRGLMFVCYQTSIVDQFEFITRNWVNNSQFPPAGGASGSEDPIIGQSARPSRERQFLGIAANYPTGPVGNPAKLPKDFVVPTGGGYFFVPSLDTLANAFAMPSTPDRIGKWDDNVVTLPNVPVHTHVLPSGKVLFWGRRVDAKGSMDQHETQAFIWDPADPTQPGQATKAKTVAAPAPTDLEGRPVNLFCSSHAFLADGRLLVAGGHWKDSEGINQATIYDWRMNSWSAQPQMVNGRWYPTVTALSDGSVLVTSGSFLDASGKTPNNHIPEIWQNGAWRSLDGKLLSLYPRQHVLVDGRVFVAGTDPIATMLDLKSSKWSDAPSREEKDRQYAPSITYKPGQIIFIGGGNDPGSDLPTNACEIIDFNSPTPGWTFTNPMLHRRRQHNATLLPDGTILVTGGSSGPGFNDLSPNKPVHEAELWDPATQRWTRMAAETEDRCYHSTAVLLPDATVLSAGGGEYLPDGVKIDPKDVHTSGQIFQPPYLFRGARPQIVSADESVDYNMSFKVKVSGPAPKRITGVKLGSVTHSNDANQRFIEFKFTLDGDTATVGGPASAEDYPPGYYMLFVLCAAGVPSSARMLRIGPALAAPRKAAAKPRAGANRTKAAAAPTSRADVPSLIEHDRAIAGQNDGTPVTVGITSKCPYGLAACWGGAYQTLTTLDGVAAVKAVANAADSTAELYLKAKGPPPIEAWARQFSALANGSYDLRGFEVTLDGTIAKEGDRLVLLGVGSRWRVELEPLAGIAKVQWDWTTRAPAAPTAQEIDAYAGLVGRVGASGRRPSARVTGPLRRDAGSWRLAVREVG